MLTIFYDGSCPLCVKEMQALKRQDNARQLVLIDIMCDDFSAFPMVDGEKAKDILHAINDKGDLLLGLDAIHQAWSLVGRGWVYAPLRWPGIRLIADACYLIFARNRYRFSKVLLGQAKCGDGQCDITRR